jgi:hypothetical protein
MAMSVRCRWLLLTVSLAGPAAAWAPAADRTSTSLKFAVTLATGLVPTPQTGRLLVVLGKTNRPEPRLTIGQTGLDAPPFLGADVDGLTGGRTVTLDQSALVFPVEHLARVPAGEYYVQAVLHTNRDLNLATAPGNLSSEPVKVEIDPARGGTVRLELNRLDPPDRVPDDTPEVRYVRLKSELLSQFHGRPMYLRAAVILPKDFEKDESRRYPLRVHIGGYGTRYTAAQGMAAYSPGFRAAWYADDAPRMLLLVLDGAGPYGDPYQVNSANNGPYGDAVTKELIPHVEERFRGLDRPWARVLDGGSTGGWVSFALQVFYPDFFNGCWSHCPDPVDFRAYELIDIYGDQNAYVNRHGFERPSKRQLNGDVAYTVRHECLMERVLGRGNRWELSGKDWCAWNATFGPRGEDGKPRPLWDGATGRIDRSVIDHWKKYDLRLVLQENWATLGPKLRGKVHIHVGEADDYFLNNAVHLLDDFLKTARPPFEGKIAFYPRAGHTGFLSEKQTLEEMAEAIKSGKARAGQ